VAAVPRLALSAGVYHKAVVTSPLFIHVINPESLVRSDTFVGIVGIAPQSLSSFHVAQSNTAKCQSVLLAGHLTSQSHDPPLPSAQSCTWNVSTVQLVSVIVTVVVFHVLELVIDAIQFQVAPVAPCGH
jgi:hypothetical protein